MDRSRSRLWIAVIFAVIVASFLAATGFVHWHLRAIDRSAIDIAQNAAPSVERLSTARAEARHLQRVVGDALDDLEAGRRVDWHVLESSRQSLDAAVADYLALPAFPSEHDVRYDIMLSKANLDRAVASAELEVRDDDVAAARANLRAVVLTADEELIGAFNRGIEINAEHARDHAVLIHGLRKKWTWAAVGLDVVCTLIAIAGALLLRRVVHAHTELVERHRRLQHERASELEHFAGRVAHDILSPLGTVGLSLQLAARTADASERNRLLERGGAALARVKTLVAGLLEFARSGGRPDGHARSDLGAALREVGAELATAAAEAKTELVVEEPGPVSVPCHPGVATSLISNLATNAIKYIGDGPVRRIRIRTLRRGGVVRVEVEDTGPGLAPGLADRAFEPWVRAPNATLPGVGLGLATVKRLAEAHGGSVGVRSTPGVGSTFWFELPEANPLERAAPDDATLGAREGSRTLTPCGGGT